MENKFGGTGVAIITPFSDGEIDYLALRIVVDHVISGGVDFIVALGSTGEAATISPSESRLVLDAIINETKGRVPLVAGNFGSNNTRALVNQINRYSFDGIDAILSASPSYSKPSQQGIYEHYTVVADASPVPVILYNVPSRTSSNISADTTIRLSKQSNIIGIKEASGDLAQAKDIIRLSAEKFFVTSGDDVLAPAMTLSGGVGVISVLANAYPAEFSQMISHFVNGQSEQGKILEDKTPESAQLLLTTKSEPLATALRLSNKWSSNLAAKNIFLTLSAQQNKTGDLTQSRLIVETWGKGRGLDTRGLVIDNGAGLSRNGRTTASLISAILKMAWSDPSMPEFVSSLSMPGVDGTLGKRYRLSPVEAKAHLKTGYLDSVRSIAGYLHLPKGRTLSIVIIMNHESLTKTSKTMENLVQQLYETD